MPHHARDRARALQLLGTAAALLLLAGCSSTRLSRSQQIQLGQQAAAQIERQYHTTQDPMVSRIGQQIAAVSDEPGLPYQFRVIDMQGVNAFSLPGGPVFVTAALRQLVNGDADELAGVLGHEVAHITLHHAAKQIQRQNWMGLAIRVLTGGGTEQQIATVVANLELLHYSREQEYAADRKGAEYAKRAGYNPMGLVRFLETLAKMGQQGAAIPWLQTHPDSAARADRLRQLIQQGRL